MTQYFSVETAGILCAAALAGLVFEVLHIPIAWMLGIDSAGLNQPIIVCTGGVAEM